MSANNPYQQYPYQANYGGAPSYAPRGYNYQPQPQVPQPFPMPQQMMPAELPIQDIKYVNRAQAEAYIVFPNTKVMLIDRDSGIAYIKTADGMGQSKTDYFRFEPVNADGSPIKPQEPIPQVNFDEFVKIDQIKEMGFVTVAQYNELASRLEQIQQQMEGSKQNVGKPKQSNQ